MLQALENLRIVPKLTIPIALTAVTMIVIVWTGTESLRRLGGITHDITERHVPAIVRAIEARNLLNEAAVSAQNLIFAAAQDGVDPNEAHFSALLAAARSKLETHGSNDVSRGAAVPRAAIADISKYGKIEHRVFALSRARHNAEAFKIAGTQGRLALAKAQAAIGALIADRRHTLVAVTAQADSIERESTLWQIFGAATGATLALALLWFIAIFQIARPLTHMAKSTRRIAKGELDIPIQEARRRDEIGILATALKGSRDNAITTKTLMQERETFMEELARAKDIAEASNRAKTDFLGNMSHELRTPLNAVIGFCEFIQSEALGPVGHEKYKEYLSDIHDSGAHLLTIIDDILDMTRIERGKIALHRTNTDLSTIIHDAIRLVIPTAAQNNITIDVDGMRSRITVFADGQKLRQILVNLLSNAVKFSHAGGAVTVAVEQRDESQISVAVKDRGIGMSPDDLKRIATPFFQTETALHRKHHGTGLGLALTKRYVELHGGRLLFESTLGAGTTASIMLPFRRTATGQVSGRINRIDPTDDAPQPRGTPARQSC